MDLLADDGEEGPECVLRSLDEVGAAAALAAMLVAARSGGQRPTTGSSRFGLEKERRVERGEAEACGKEREDVIWLIRWQNTMTWVLMLMP